MTCENFTPFQHQIDAQKIMEDMEKNGKGGILADEMGLGKTITMCLFLKNNKLYGKTNLIVCPYSLMKTWENEIYRVNEDDKPNILIYHGLNRDKSIKDKSKNWEYIITTYAIIGSGELNKRRWGRVVLDESHYIKNGLKTNAPKCAKAVFEIGKKSEFNWCISGTPFNNRIQDIASQCHFIGTKPYDTKEWWKDNEKNTESLTKWRDKFVLRRTKEGMLDPPIYHDIVVDHNPFELEVIEVLRAEALERYKKWKVSSGIKKIELQGVLLALIQKLRMFSNSCYCKEENINTSIILKNNAKVEKIINDLDDQIFKDPKKGVVVFSQFTSFLSILEKVIEEQLCGIEVYKFTGSMNDIERDTVVKQFNNSIFPRVILVSLMAGGVGLSLHHGSSSVFICEPYYNSFVEQQAEERVHRLGQEHQVEIKRYLVSNSVETWVQMLKKSKIGIASIIDLVKVEDIPINFNFDNIAFLFNEYVSVNENKEKKTKKKIVPKVVKKKKK